MPHKRVANPRHTPGTLPATAHHPSPPPRRALSRLALGGLLLGLGACAATPPPAPDSGIDLPATWSTDVSSAARGGMVTADAAWWSRFGDPLLSELVLRALQANPSVQAAQAALRQARALRDVAAARLGPTLDGSASAQRVATDGRASGSSYQAGLDASWEIDIFGANRSALGASEAGARASAASLGDVQVSVAAEVALAYVALRGAQTQLGIAEQNLASQLETLQITRWRQQAGLVGALEVEQAQTAAEQTRAALPALQTGIAQGGHALAVLTGQSPAALDRRLAERQPLPQAAIDAAASLPAETLRQRADVRAAEHRLSAEVARLAQAEAARLPSFRLGGSLGLNALTLGALSGAPVVGSLLAGVTLPLFDGGALRAQAQAQQAVLDQALASYRSTVLAALQEVEDALVALHNDRLRVQRLQAAALSAGNAAQLADDRYRSGLVDFQVVLDTQRTLLATQERLASARTDVATDQVRLYKALGGGWRDDTQAAATP